MKKPSEMKQVRLLIGIPSRGEFQSSFALSLTFLIHLITSNPVVKIDGEPHLLLWSIEVKNSSNLQGNRQKLVDQALASDCTHLLFLDDDMVFDPSMIYDWLMENRPVIAANCPTRGIPTYPTARNQGGLAGELVYVQPEGAEVPNRARWERVWRVGTGIVLLRADVLKALPRPAFTQRWDPERDDYVGEDWVMFEHIEAAGFPIIVDAQKSASVEHVGRLNYTHAMVAGQRRLEGPQLVLPDKTFDVQEVLTEYRHK